MFLSWEGSEGLNSFLNVWMHLWVEGGIEELSKRL